MTRLLLSSALAGVALAVALAWSFRSEVAYAREPAPAATRPMDASAYVAAAVAGCSAGGGTWLQGVEDGVVVGRCYPLPNVGVVPVANGARR